MSDIAVVADKDSGIGFKSIGFDTYFFEENNFNKDKFLPELFSVLRKNYKIIFLTEFFYQAFMEEIEEFTKNKLFPIVIAIPSVKGQKNLSKNIVKKLVEKALGGSFLDS